MSENDTPPADVPPTGEPPVEAPSVNEKFRELAELQTEIQRRLRSNQRFLEKFLDEDFVDDEGGGEDSVSSEDEEL